MRIIILGSNGMIGSAILHILSSVKDADVYGFVRKKISFQKYKQVTFKDFVDVYKKIEKYKPNLVINALGITKHNKNILNLKEAINVNSIFPIELSEYCDKKKIKFIHISTDCVFSGIHGNYNEKSLKDANDFYGQTKIISENICKRSLVLRTSTIGHEFSSTNGLLEWFLSQDKICKGYTRAIFSGLTNIEFAKIIRDYFLKQNLLFGLFNVGGSKISKYSLLNIISNIYKKSIVIEKDEKFEINRSLNSNFFYLKTGYKPPSWENMIKNMYEQKFIWNKKNV